MNDQHKCYYEDCGHSYSSKYNLVRHINTMHLNIKKYFCQLCSKRFSSKQALTVHVKSHTKSPRLCVSARVVDRTEFLLSDHYQEIRETEPPIISIGQPPALALVTEDRRRMQARSKLPVVLALIRDDE